jgi:hypothetical protein
MKYNCKKCGEPKSKSEFGLFDEGTLICKTCVDKFVNLYNPQPKKSKSTGMTRQQIRAELVRVLGSKCCKCGMDDVRCLQVDHVHGKGIQEIKAKGYYRMYLDALTEINNGDFGNYQLLCANCNWIKRHTNGEIAKKSSESHNKISQ